MPPRWWYRRRKLLVVVGLVILLTWSFLRRITWTPAPGLGNHGQQESSSSIPPMPSSEPGLHSWVLLESHEPRRDCTSVGFTFPGYQVLLVADCDIITGHSWCVCSGSNAVVTFRSGLPGDLQALPPLQLAALYLTKIGAEVIFFLSPEGAGHYSSSYVHHVRSYRGLLCSSGHEFFDSNSYFGCNSTISSKTEPHKRCRLCDLKPPAIQVAAATDHMTCDSTAPPVTLEKNNYLLKFSLKNALFSRDAFWALPVVPLEGAEVQVWLLALQRLLWSSHNHMILYRDSQAAQSSALSSIVPASASGDHQLLLTIQGVLSKWHCSLNDHMLCVQDFLKMLQKYQYISESSLSLFKNYHAALGFVGYSVAVSHGSISACSTVAFHAINQSSPQYLRWDKTLYTPLTNVHSIQNVIEDTCKGHPLPNYVNLNFTHPWVQFDKTLLIVTFNNPHYNSIPFIESIYRAFYPVILYCGPGFPDTEKFPSLKVWTFSFVSYDSTPEGHFPGALNYECLSLAYDLHYSVEGYQVISDDVLLALYKLRDLRSHLVWFTPQKDIRIGDVRKLRECRLGMCDFHPRWNWWESYQNEVLNALFDLEAKSKSSRVAFRCHYQLLRLNKGPLRANRAFSDSYYIPSRLAQDFSQVAKIFRQHNVFLEIAIPTIIQCLENPEDIEPLPGLILWQESRDQPWQHFNIPEFRLNTFLHPVKWSYLATGEPGYTEFFCTKIIPFMHDRYGRIK